jgi:predicted heme/steroid binding protein
MGNSSNEESAENLTFFDVLRVISGLLLLNALLSYAFTQSTMWGYSGKYVDSMYLIHRLKGSPIKEYTVNTLWNDVQNSGRLLISINKKVYDVTASYDVYNPKTITSRYGIFVGRDCTRIFINGCFHDLNQCTWNLENMKMDQSYVNTTVLKWENFYQQHPKYWQVGYLNVSNDDRDPPPACTNGILYPS